jgi:UDP-glucose 4-epimerase
MHILVTGGCGYIGSHTCLSLLEAGFSVTVLDNLSNSSPMVIERVARISGRRPELIVGDVRNSALLDTVFARRRVDAVIHFAGLKSVAESVAKPLAYFDSNIGGTIALLQAMDCVGCRTLVFSSSATIYGLPRELPLREDVPCGDTTNPYARSKFVAEQILADLSHATGGWRVCCLRYFNPAGAHPSGLIGESPRSVPNNLFPYVGQVAIGMRNFLSIYGGNYPTPDGTAIRDYIHVMDLANAHILTLHHLVSQKADAPLALNLGTGHGHSVLEVVAAFESASGRRIPYQIVGRRDGDVAACYADASMATALLGWKAKHDLAAMCRDAWAWQLTNSREYAVAAERPSVTL